MKNLLALLVLIMLWIIWLPLLVTFGIIIVVLKIQLWLRSEELRLLKATIRRKQTR